MSDIKYTVTTTLTPDGNIQQEVFEQFNDVHRRMWMSIIDLGDRQIRDRLVELGWTPPEQTTAPAPPKVKRRILVVYDEYHTRDRDLNNRVRVMQVDPLAVRLEHWQTSPYALVRTLETSDVDYDYAVILSMADAFQFAGRSYADVRFMCEVSGSVIGYLTGLVRATYSTEAQTRIANTR